jgi:hypothetical protein
LARVGKPARRQSPSQRQRCQPRLLQRHRQSVRGRPAAQLIAGRLDRARDPGIRAIADLERRASRAPGGRAASNPRRPRSASGPPSSVWATKQHARRSAAEECSNSPYRATSGSRSVESVNSRSAPNLRSRSQLHCVFATPNATARPYIVRRRRTSNATTAATAREISDASPTRARYGPGGVAPRHRARPS